MKKENRPDSKIEGIEEPNYELATFSTFPSMYAGISNEMENLRCIFDWLQGR